MLAQNGQAESRAVCRGLRYTLKPKRRYILMRAHTLLSKFLAGWFCLAASAQTPEAVPTQDPGFARAVLMDRAEVRILRVEIQPGAVRRVHTHNDVPFHLFLPVSGEIELTISSKAVKAAVGQAYFLEKGTPHGFRNTGTAPAMALEVFVRAGTPVAQQEARAMAAALAVAVR
jgi:quercetin dioxygenase-like cupin family protein